MPRFLIPIFFLFFLSFFALLSIFFRIDPEKAGFLSLFSFAFLVFLSTTSILTIFFFRVRFLPRLLVKRVTHKIIQPVERQEQKRWLKNSAKMAVLVGGFLGTLTFLKLTALLNIFNLIVLLVLVVVLGFYWLSDRQ